MFSRIFLVWVGFWVLWVCALFLFSTCSALGFDVVFFGVVVLMILAFCARIATFGLVWSEFLEFGVECVS